MSHVICFKAFGLLPDAPKPPKAPAAAAKQGLPANSYDSMTSFLTSPNKPKRGFGSTILGAGKSDDILGG